MESPEPIIDDEAQAATDELVYLLRTIPAKEHHRFSDLFDMIEEQTLSLFVIEGRRVAADGTVISAFGIYPSSLYMELLAAIRSRAADLDIRV